MPPHAAAVHGHCDPERSGHPGRPQPLLAHAHGHRSRSPMHVHLLRRAPMPAATSRYLVLRPLTFYAPTLLSALKPVAAALIAAMRLPTSRALTHICRVPIHASHRAHSLIHIRPPAKSCARIQPQRFAQCRELAAVALIAERPPGHPHTAHIGSSLHPPPLRRAAARNRPLPAHTSYAHAHPNGVCSLRARAAPHARAACTQPLTERAPMQSTAAAKHVRLYSRPPVAPTLHAH